MLNLVKSIWHEWRQKREFQYRCSNFYIKNLLTLEHQIMADLSDLKQMVAANADVIESAIVLLDGLKTKLDDCKNDPALIEDLKNTLQSETQKLAEAVAMNTNQ